MKWKTITVTKEYDKKGNLTRETTETVEKDSEYTYPAGYTYLPSYGYYRPQQTDWGKWTC